MKEKWGRRRKAEKEGKSRFLEVKEEENRIWGREFPGEPREPNKGTFGEEKREFPKKIGVPRNFWAFRSPQRSCGLGGIPKKELNWEKETPKQSENGSGGREGIAKPRLEIPEFWANSGINPQPRRGFGNGSIPGKFPFLLIPPGKGFLFLMDFLLLQQASRKNRNFPLPNPGFLPFSLFSEGRSRGKFTFLNSFPRFLSQPGKEKK